MTQLHISDLEAAINFWRARRAPSDSLALGPELDVLATVYAKMVVAKSHWVEENTLPEVALQAWLAWYDTTPDTPCIAICSTSQGDAICKGCGRSFEEVQRWPEMTPGQKRLTWRRITQESSSLRFTRYLERAGSNRAPDR